MTIRILHGTRSTPVSVLRLGSGIYVAEGADGTHELTTVPGEYGGQTPVENPAAIEQATDGFPLLRCEPGFDVELDGLLDGSLRLEWSPNGVSGWLPFADADGHVLVPSATGLRKSVDWGTIDPDAIAAADVALRLAEYDASGTLIGVAWSSAQDWRVITGFKQVRLKAVVTRAGTAAIDPVITSVDVELAAYAASVGSPGEGPPGGGGGPFSATVTIPSATVGSNLTDFPVMVRLSDMPAGFWTHVREDGGDIRVKTTGGSQVPMDLVRFDYAGQDGVLFFLAATVASGSDSVWEIHYGDAGLVQPLDTDTNGRNAVWAAYESVLLMGLSGGEDRTGGAHASTTSGGGSLAQLLTLVETSPDLSSHNGICWDGTHYYSVDNNAIRKWDASWTLVASNTDPIGDAAIGGTPTINHCGDLDVHDGKLYIPMERHPNSGGYNAHIGVFDASDLSFIQAFDISAQGHEAASIAYCDRDGLLYLVDFDGNDSSVFKYDPADGSYQGTLTADTVLEDRQGITWVRDRFWVSVAGLPAVGAYRMGYDGAVYGKVGFTSGLAGIQGIGHRGEDLLSLSNDPGGSDLVRRWTGIDETLCAGGGGSTPGSGAGVGATGRSSYQTYTLGVSAAIANKSGNRVPVSYWDAGVDNVRQVIAYRGATGSLSLWDASNSWLDPSPVVDPTLDQFYRIHAVYEGTTSRKMYVDGDLKASQAGISAVPGTLDMVLIFLEDSSGAEWWNGKVGFVYLYPGVLSADWVAAEYDMLNAPGSFYSIGAEESP